MRCRDLHVAVCGDKLIQYRDLLAGTNDYEAVRRAGPGGHKEINRTNLPLDEALTKLDTPVVRDQLALLRVRNTSPVFTEDAAISFIPDGSVLEIRWSNAHGTALLYANFADCAFTVRVTDGEGAEQFLYEQHKGRESDV